MPNNLNVTLDQSGTPWTVDVDQNGKDNEVAHGPHPQTITWQLTGNAASGSFVPPDDPHAPGFEWNKPQPPSGVFSKASLSPNRKRLTIDDTNDSADTAGTWTYVLRIKVGKTVYSTRTRSITITDTNPWIRNKPGGISPSACAAPP